MGFGGAVSMHVSNKVGMHAAKTLCGCFHAKLLQAINTDNCMLQQGVVGSLVTVNTGKCVLQETDTGVAHVPAVQRWSWVSIRQTAQMESLHFGDCLVVTRFIPPWLQYGWLTILMWTMNG